RRSISIWFSVAVTAATVIAASGRCRWLACAARVRAGDGRARIGGTYGFRQRAVAMYGGRCGEGHVAPNDKRGKISYADSQQQQQQQHWAAAPLVAVTYRA